MNGGGKPTPRPSALAGLFPGSPNGSLVPVSGFVFKIFYFAKYLRATFTLQGSQRAISLIHSPTMRPEVGRNKRPNGAACSQQSLSFPGPIACLTAFPPPGLCVVQ